MRKISKFFLALVVRYFYILVMALDHIWFIVTIPFYGYPFGIGGHLDSSLIVHFVLYALLMCGIYYVFLKIYSVNEIKQCLSVGATGFWDLGRMVPDCTVVATCILAFGTEFTQGFAFGNNALNFFGVYDLAASWSGSILVWRLLLKF